MRAEVKDGANERQIGIKEYNDCNARRERRRKRKKKKSKYKL